MSADAAANSRRHFVGKLENADFAIGEICLRVVGEIGDDRRVNRASKM